MLGRLKMLKSLVGHSSFCQNQKEYFQLPQWYNFCNDLHKIQLSSMYLWVHYAAVNIQN